MSEDQVRANNAFARVSVIVLAGVIGIVGGLAASSFYPALVQSLTADISK